MKPRQVRPRSMGIVVRRWLARHSDAGDGLRRAEPARAVPAPANDDARATEVGGLHVGWPHDVSHRNGAGSGRDQPAARNGVATMRMRPPHSGQAGAMLADEMAMSAMSAIEVSGRSIARPRADRQSARLVVRQVLARKPK